MKQIFYILLFCLISESVFAGRKNFAQRWAKGLFPKKLTKLNEQKLRKLDTDTASDESGDDTYVLPPAENYTPTPDNQSETGNATAQDSQVIATKPVSTKGRKTKNKSLKVQIMKFHSFRTENGGKSILFSTFFYFISRTIPYSIIFRLRVTYGSRLRNLEDQMADSLRTNCIISDKSYGQSVGTEGKNVNYNCNANATKDASNAKIELNTDFDMVLADKDGNTEVLSFSEVNFDEKAAEEAQNMKENKVVLNGEIITFTLSSASMEDKTMLQLVGTLSDSTLRSLSLSEGANDVTMNLVQNSENAKDYNCTLTKSSSTGTLKCDTSNAPMDSTVGDQSIKNGYSSDGTFISINTQKVNSNTPLVTEQSGSNYRHSKSSSGLSGGAIAGIVIACVVVLVGAAVAVIMLRKPSSAPIDNTTSVANLGNDNV